MSATWRLDFPVRSTFTSPGSFRARKPVLADGAVPGLLTVIQAVDDAPRYHVDIETDDLAAEVARLTTLCG